MIRALTLTAATMPLSAWVIRGRPEEASLLLFLYICVAAALLAWFSLPYIDWTPDPSAL